jgi:hypothetical protein
MSSTSAAFATEAAAKRNDCKYAELGEFYHIFSFAFEALGPIN